MLIASANDWIGLIDVIVGCFLTAALGAVAFYFRGMRDEVRDNSRHLRGLMFSVWNLVWRVDALEDFAKENHGYSPPRAMPEWPFNPE